MPRLQRTRRSDTLPEAETAALGPLLGEIDRRKAERNAAVAAHNYMTPDIFATADLRVCAARWRP